MRTTIIGLFTILTLILGSTSVFAQRQEKDRKAGNTKEQKEKSGTNAPTRKPVVVSPPPPPSKEVLKDPNIPPPPPPPKTKQAEKDKNK